MMFQSVFVLFQFVVIFTLGFYESLWGGTTRITCKKDRAFERKVLVLSAFLGNYRDMCKKDEKSSRKYSAMLSFLKTSL